MVEEHTDEVVGDTDPIDLSTSSITSPSKDTPKDEQKETKDDTPPIPENSHKTPKNVTVKPVKELQITPPSPPTKRPLDDSGDSATPTSSQRKMICKKPIYMKDDNPIDNSSKSSNKITSPRKEQSSQATLNKILLEALAKSSSSGQSPNKRNSLESVNTNFISNDTVPQNADAANIYRILMSQNECREAMSAQNLQQNIDNMRRMEALKLFLRGNSPGQILWQETQRNFLYDLIRNQEMAASLNYLHALASGHSSFQNVPQTFPFLNNSHLPSLTNYSPLNHLFQSAYQPLSLTPEDIHRLPETKPSLFRSTSLDDSRTVKFDHLQAPSRCTNSEPSIPKSHEFGPAELALQRMYFQNLRPQPNSQPESKELSKFETPATPVSSNTMSSSNAGQDYLRDEQQKQLEALINRKKCGRALTGRHVRDGRGASMQTLATLRHKLTIKLSRKPSTSTPTRGISKRGRRKLSLNRSISLPSRID